MPVRHDSVMELRHLRYFIAVAEEKNVTTAAKLRLFTSQPSLSRQIRDLEEEVGTELFTRSVQGVELTPAGRVFLDHARLALMQVDVAIEAARKVARPAKSTFAIGFLTGHEMNWLPEVMHALGKELPSVDVTVSSNYSPDLAEAVARGRLDLAFLRAEPNVELSYHPVAKEPLLVLMPSDHALTARAAIAPKDLVGQTFIGVSRKATVLQGVVERYLRKAGVDLRPDHVVDNLAMAMSLVASTRGVALMPAYAKNLLPWSVTSRPLTGPPATIDLVAGFSPANRSPVLKHFLSQLDSLAARVAKKAGEGVQ